MLRASRLGLISSIRLDGAYFKKIKRTHSVHPPSPPPTLSADGGGGGVNLPPDFQKGGGGLAGP